jgi:hypothetical protein
MRRAGRLRVRVLMMLLDFFNLPNPSSRTRALGLTQPLRETSKKRAIAVTRRESA